MTFLIPLRKSFYSSLIQHFSIVIHALRFVCQAMQLVPRLLRQLSRTGGVTCLKRSVVSSSLPDEALPNTNYVNEIFSGIHRYPERMAMIDGITNARYSYSDLQSLTLSIASGLRKQSIGRGSVMAIFTNNRPEFILAHLGIVAAGATSCPVNGNYTASELAFILKDSNSQAVITDLDRLDIVREAASSVPSVRTIYLIGASSRRCSAENCKPFDELLNDDGSSTRECVEVDPDADVAMLPYSSGTSGLPKGVILSHNNTAINLRQMRAVVKNPIGSEKVLGVLPFYHIYALNIIIGNTLHTGGTLVTMPKFEPQQFLQNIDKHEIDSLYVVPPLVLFMMQHPMVQQYQLTSLRKAMSAAAPLGIESEAREKLNSINPKLCFFQGYGLTETSPLTHLNMYDTPGPLPAYRCGSIGRAVPNQECKIVHRETKAELGPDEVGELVIRGPHVMKGYWRRPDATASCIDEEGWFFTGDVAYYNEQGFFFVTDRVKELIKYKGLQVRKR